MISLKKILARLVITEAKTRVLESRISMLEKLTAKKVRVKKEVKVKSDE